MTPALDLSTWLTKSEAARLLGISERTLERMGDTGPERRMRPRPGKRPEPVYHPADVEALAAAAVPAPRLNPPAMPRAQESAELAPAEGGMPAGLATALRVVEALATIAQRARPEGARAPRGPWITLKVASAETGVSVALLRRLVAAGELPVLRDRSVKVRASDIDSLDIPSILSRLAVTGGTK